MPIMPVMTVMPVMPIMPSHRLSSPVNSACLAYHAYHACDNSHASNAYHAITPAVFTRESSQSLFVMLFPFFLNDFRCFPALYAEICSFIVDLVIRSLS